MPIFDYICHECHTSVERITSWDERHFPQLCEVCGKKLERMAIHKTAPPQFKCAGFYDTDYKQKKGIPE